MRGVETRPFLSFFVGDDQFAAPAAEVSEVFRRPKITRVPGAPHSLLGVAGLRGRATPVVSLARLLGIEERSGAASRLLLLTGGQAVALSIERMGGFANLAAPDDDLSGPARLYALEAAGLRALDLEDLLRQAFKRGGDSGARPVSPQSIEAIEAAAMAQVALLSFEVADQTYALPVDEVSEVLAIPPKMAAFPHSDAASLGVVDLRGSLLPIVSLRRLLGLPQGLFTEGRIVVARLGEARVGLAVDRLNAIHRVDPETIDAAPVVLNRGDGEAQVQSICRLPDGRGLIAVLAAERLFRDETVAQMLDEVQSRGEDMSDEQGRAASARYLIFSVGGDEFGLPLTAVEEVARLPERMTPVPNAPGLIEGVLNLRGKITPIIDQRRRFDADPASNARQSRVLVTSVAGRQVGFIVDGVSEILSIADDQLDKAPELNSHAGRLFTQVATLDGGARIILLVEPEELLDGAERDLLAGLDAAGLQRAAAAT